MHLHLHLKNCFLDYGPAHAFWYFSFECYNGLLGSYPTNQKNIELQIMRKFINSQILINNKRFLHLETNKASVMLSDVNCFNVQKKSTANLPGICFEVDETIHLLPPMHSHVFSASELNDLDRFYKALYPDFSLSSLSAFYMRSGRAVVCGEVRGSVLNATSNRYLSTIMAYWPEHYGALANTDKSKFRVGIVQYYCMHKIKITQYQSSHKTMNHVVAYVSWMENHSHSNCYGASATLCIPISECSPHFSFIPVQRIQRIHGIAATCTIKLNIIGFEEKLLVAAPVPMRLSL